MPSREPPFAWTCPFCGRDTTVTDADYSHWHEHLLRDQNLPRRFLEAHVIHCPNPDCGRVSIGVETSTVVTVPWGETPGDRLQAWQLEPPSDAKVFPDYVPQAIRDDYTEACLIKHLSPKASATLSRRCLQGMIRDFWGAKARNLKAEIEAIQEKVDPLTWKAIDGVRSVGNIGAHMETDIDVIVEVDPGEAGLLIWLVERLIGEWYVNRREREEALKSVVELGAAKQSARRKTTGAGE